VLDVREDARDVVHRRESPGDDGPTATVGTRAPSLGSPYSPAGDGVVSPRLTVSDAIRIGPPAGRHPRGPTIIGPGSRVKPCDLGDPGADGREPVALGTAGSSVRGLPTKA
jgi:hypothetical protein